MALRFIRLATSCGALAIACFVIAPSAQATHARPKSASPVFMSLVPAYNQCVSPNRTHGTPLAFPSCNPPGQASAQATVGTPDAFGGPANSTGSLRLKAVPCDSNCPSPTFGDMLIYSELNDVRCVPAGARCGTANASGPPDYSGETRFSFAFRLTDHWNATAPGGGTEAATVQDFAVDLSGPCAETGSTSIGSSCGLNTSMNATVPGAFRETVRAIWALDDVRIHDGGPDGDGETTADNTLFARPGVFIP